MESENPEMDSFNQFMVGSREDAIVILNYQNRALTRKEALNLAAWLVATADYEGKEFSQILDAVMSS
jgi:hypothetical protein